MKTDTPLSMYTAMKASETELSPSAANFAKTPVRGYTRHDTEETAVTETDAKYRSIRTLHECGESCNGRLDHCGVSGSIRDEEAIEGLFVVAQEVMVPRNDFQLDASRYETPNLVVFHSNVDRQHSQRPAGGMEARGNIFGGFVQSGRLYGYRSDEVGLIRIIEGDVGVFVVKGSGRGNSRGRGGFKDCQAARGVGR